MSSSITKQIIINKFGLPQDIINIVKDYLFYKIQKILETDERYKLLLTIPSKEYDLLNDTVSVCMPITDEKDYVLVYCDFITYGRLELQTLEYLHQDVIYCTEAEVHFIK